MLLEVTMYTCSLNATLPSPQCEQQVCAGNRPEILAAGVCVPHTPTRTCVNYVDGWVGAPCARARILHAEVECSCCIASATTL